MTIKLKPEQVRIIEAESARGRYGTADEVLEHTLAALKEKNHDRQGTTRQKNLAQFRMNSPVAGAELNLERQKDHGRPIEL